MARVMVAFIDHFQLNGVKRLLKFLAYRVRYAHIRVISSRCGWPSRALR